MADYQRPRMARRTVLTGVGAAALMLAAGRLPAFAKTVPAHGKAMTDGAKAGKTRLAYISSYTPEGKGITLWRADGATGALELLKTFETSNPSWIVLDSKRRFLYAVNENEPEGGVTSYSVDVTTGELTKISEVSSKGKWPCHISVTPDDRHLLVANYGTGTVSVFPTDNGIIGEAADIEGNPGALNPAQARDNPPGQTAPSDHGGPHFHMTQTDPAGRFVIVNDAGRDQILRFGIDAASGKLSPAAIPAIDAEPGSAPRHFVFHPNGRILYNLQEQDGIIAVYDYDPATAGMKLRQSLSFLPGGFAGSFLGSEIAISPNGRFLYAATRIHDAITQFAINRDGSLTYVEEVWTHTDYPRSFTITPDGTMLYACNQKGNAVTSFHIEEKSGALDFTGIFTPVASPVCMVFLT